MDTILKENHDRIMEDYRRALKETEQETDEMKSMIDGYYEEEFSFEGVFSPDTFYSSMFLNIFTFLETNFRGLLKQVLATIHIKPELSKITFNQYSNRLQEYIDFNGKMRTHWNSLLLFNSIRNLIAHRNGEIDEKKDKAIIKRYSEYITTPSRSERISELMRSGKISANYAPGYFKLPDSSLLLDFLKQIDDLFSNMICNENYLETLQEIRDGKV